jgi:hypothetical protein
MSYRRIATAIALALALVPAAATAAEKPVATAKDARIIGGTTAVAGTWPFIASLRYSSNNGHFCGGSVITPTAILTAAHCVTNGAAVYAPSSLYVVTGQTSLSATSGQRIRVARIIVHPSWNKATWAGDAAILVLASATSAPTIAIANTTNEANALAAGAWEWTAGWGSQSPLQPDNNSIGATWPDALQNAALHTYTAAACNGYYQSTTFSNWQLCVGREDATFCNGDSGGPHVVQTASGQWVQIGITSFTVLNQGWSCTYKYSGVTRTAPLFAWMVAALRATPAAGAAVAGDFIAPVVTLKAQRARTRQVVRIRYRVLDDSGTSSETIVIKRGKRVVRRVSTTFGAAAGASYTVRAGKLAAGTYTVTVTSKDRTGNRARTRTAKLRVVR